MVFDEDKKLQYRFGMPGEAVADKEIGALLQVLGNYDDVDYLVVSGSLPPGTSTEVFHELANIAKQINGKLIVDTSGDGLKAAVKEGLYLIKPNLRELASLVGKEWGWEQVLQYGVAAGSAATLHKGTELCSLSDTERIFAQMKRI